MQFYGIILPLHHQTLSELDRLEKLCDRRGCSLWSTHRFNSSILTRIIERVNLQSEYWYPYLQKRGNKMAKKTVVKGAFEGYKLVNVRMTEAEKKEFKAWLKVERENADLHIGDLLSSGYKFSISQPNGDATFYATLTSSDEGNEDYRSSCTSHARDWFTALMLALYKWERITRKLLVERAVDVEDDLG